jgi:hypothetical protein
LSEFRWSRKLTQRFKEQAIACMRNWLQRNAPDGVAMAIESYAG